MARELTEQEKKIKKYVEINNLINNAFGDIEDVLVENKVETIVAFSIGNILGSTFEKIEQLLKAEVNGMRPIKMYQCDKCGAVFKDMAKAAECEAKHLSPKFTECEYNTGYVMPEIIRAGFCNDKIGVYKLIRIEESEVDSDVFKDS